MMKFVLGIAGAGLAALIGNQAMAIPTCTTTLVATGGSGAFADSDLGTGVCVQAEDKLFGTFNFGNLPGTGAGGGGTVSFSFTSPGGVDNHNITFTNPLLASTTYNFGYEVAVITTPPFPSGNSITNLLADILQTTSTTATTLLKTTTPPGTSGSINLSKTGITETGPNEINYAVGTVTDLNVAEALTTGTGANTTGTENTIIENIQLSSVPEPTSMALLGSALVGFGVFRRRRKTS